MGRAKLPMKFIEKEKTRSITFLKRKKGLKKKAYELSTLCDVPICIIIYPHPNTAATTAAAKCEPEIWPSSPDKVLDILSRYALLPQEDQQKRALNLSDILLGKKKKAEQDLIKLQQKSVATKYPTWHTALDGLDRDQLSQMASDLDEKCNTISGIIALMVKNQGLISSLAPEPISALDSSGYVQPGGHPIELAANLDSYHHFVPFGMDPQLPLPSTFSTIDMNFLQSAPTGRYTDNGSTITPLSSKHIGAMSRNHPQSADDVVPYMATMAWCHGGGSDVMWLTSTSMNTALPLSLPLQRPITGHGQDCNYHIINDLDYEFNTNKLDE